MRFVTCVGSRSILDHPDRDELIEHMHLIAAAYAQRGWICRSGNAPGCDQIWAEGFNKINPEQIELYLPHVKFHPEAIVEGNKLFTEAYQWAYAYLPNVLERSHIENLRRDPRTGAPRRWIDLHARNVHQVFGIHTNGEKSELLLCWTPGGQDVGGTRTAILITRREGIPVVNLGDRVQLNTMLERVACPQ